MAAVVVAAGLVAPPVAAAQDDPATYRCRQAAWAAGYSTAKFHLVVGTDADDAFTAGQLVPSARDIVCGFDGNDTIANLKGGDVLLGGLGDDAVGTLQDAAFVGGPGADHVDAAIRLFTYARSYIAGPFYGGQGADSVDYLESGTFFAGDGPDLVFDLYTDGPEDCCSRYVGGSGNDRLTYGGANPFNDTPTFEGGPGNDVVETNVGTGFDGGPGADRIGSLTYGSVRGGAGDDRIDEMRDGFGDFHGGTGADSVGVIADDPTSYSPDLVFWGEEDDDRVDVLRYGIFNGGLGLDSVGALEGGVFNQD